MPVVFFLRGRDCRFWWQPGAAVFFIFYSDYRYYRYYRNYRYYPSS